MKEHHGTFQGILTVLVMVLFASNYGSGKVINSSEPSVPSTIKWYDLGSVVFNFSQC